MADLPKNLKNIGATIILEKTGLEFHTVTDWNLCITSAVNIEEPEQQTNYIVVPGSNTMLDVSEALTGRPTFKKRKISIDLAGLDDAMSWDAIISGLRNTIEGRVVHIIFDNDPNYYWKGRAHLKGFDRAAICGSFTLEMDQADPFKYSVLSNVDPWLWDPFDFENDTVPEEPVIEVNGTETVVVPRGSMYTCPEFTVTGMTSPLTLKFGTRTYSLKSGYNYFPALMIGGDEEVTLVFNGVGNVVMEYRGGSL